LADPFGVFTLDIAPCSRYTALMDAIERRGALGRSARGMVILTIGSWLPVLSLLSGTAWAQSVVPAPGPNAGVQAPRETTSSSRGDDQNIEPVFKAVTGAFFAVSVPDLAAATMWYAEKLGLHTVMSTEGPGGGRVAVLEGNGLIVELVYLPEAQPLSRVAPALRSEEHVHGLFKAGLVIEDFDGLVTRLRARHVDIAYGPFPTREGQRANVVIRDHAGNLIQFFGR